MDPPAPPGITPLGEKTTGLTGGEEEGTVFAGGKDDGVWTTELVEVEERTNEQPVWLQLL